MDLVSYLQAIGEKPDDQISIATTALRLAAADRPGLSLGPYQKQLDALGPRVQARYADLIAAGAADDLETEIAALKHILVDQDGYIGDKTPHTHMENANLIGTMNTRHGLPVTLGILYLHAASAAGFDVVGIDFPSHFLLQGRKGGHIQLFDPAGACTLLNAADLRTMLKSARGPTAELKSDYYRPLSARGILIRLLNNIKFQQISLHDYPAALVTLGYMQKIDPSEFRVYLDRGVLHAKMGHKGPALADLERYKDHLPPLHPNRADIAALIRDIQWSLPDS